MQHARALRHCELCDKRIPPERLRLLPETRRCVRCSDARPLTDADLPCDGAADAEERVDSAHGMRDRGDWS